MTTLVYVEGPGGFSLRVCGSPSAAWFAWLRDTDVPLTEGQSMWRDLAAHQAHEVAAQPTPMGRKPKGPKACAHPYSCDRCGFCEECTCECHEFV